MFIFNEHTHIQTHRFCFRALNMSPVIRPSAAGVLSSSLVFVDLLSKMQKHPLESYCAGLVCCFQLISLRRRQIYHTSRFQSHRLDEVDLLFLT